MDTHESDRLVVLGPAAVAAMKSWALEDGSERLALRVDVEPGGCFGHRFRIAVDDSRSDTDLVLAQDGVEVVVGRDATEYARGATIEYSEEGFSAVNPRARGTCMCGASFAISDPTRQGTSS